MIDETASSTYMYGHCNSCLKGKVNFVLFLAELIISFIKQSVILLDPYTVENLNEIMSKL